MNHNFKDDDEATRSELLKHDQKVNASDGNYQTTTIDQGAKRKKIIKWGIIGAIITIIVILAIVLPIVLIKKDENPDNPPVPPVPPHYNPYQVNNSTIVDSQSGLSGVINAASAYEPEKHILALNKLLQRSGYSNSE